MINRIRVGQTYGQLLDYCKGSDASATRDSHNKTERAHDFSLERLQPETCTSSSEVYSRAATHRI
jgi:hypothetical protein